MKKTLLLLAVALLGCSAMNAQFKKSWDFTKGLSEETVANLNADATNWASNGTDGEGITNNWKNNAKVDASSYLKANGEVIPEMEGLYINIGSNGSNSIHLAQNKIRLTRKNTIITFPKLANGQTITVRARSANATATNRGFIANSSNLVYISGPAGGTCLGNQAEGATPDEDGNYTLIWQVQTEETDSVEVSLKLSPDGGLDIASFMIDNGDAPVIEEDPNVAYVYSGDPDADNFRQYAGLDDYTTVTNIAVSELLEGSVSVDSIESFDLVVLPKSAYEPEGAAAYLKERRNHVPMLDLSIPSYHQPVNNVSTINVFEGYLDSEWFEELEYSGENDDELQLFNGEAGAYGIEYAFPENGVYSGDVLATTGDSYTLYIYGKKNTYMNFPLDDEQIVADGDLNLTETGLALISNIVKCLKNTKAKVVEAAKPTVKTVYEDGVSTVSLSTSIPNATIYYTVDGSEPTVESEIYLGSLAFTQPATLKAIVVAPAYYNSAVLEEQVIIKTQLAMPSVSVAESEGFSTITLSAAEGASVYYSFNGITTAADAAAYSEPVVITEPATIYAFASSETMLPSEMMIRDVRVGGIPSVKDTVAHFTANETDWFTNVAFYNYNMEAQDVPADNWAAKAAYYWGKSAWNYYGTEIDHTEPVYEEDGKTPVKCADGVTDSIKTVYKADPTAVKYVYSTTDPQWRLASQGQLFTGETNVAATYAIGDPAASVYNAQSAQDLIGEPSKGKMTFGGKVSGDPYSAKIESTQKFQAPFDVVTYVTNGGGSAFVLEVQVSADGENWTVLDTVNVANVQRRYCKTRMHYDGTDEVYVRMAHVSGSTKAQVYDIYVITTGEKTDIEAIEMNEAQNADKRIYDLQGRRVATMQPGRIYLQNGKKVMTK